MNRIEYPGSPEDFIEWREGMGRTVELFDIVVNSERGVGRGRWLVMRMLSEIPRDCALVYAITRMSNTIAHQFYEALGFRIVGRLHNFYRDADGDESALMYGVDL